MAHRDLHTGYRRQRQMCIRVRGVYVNESKIASLGFRIRRGCSYHGLSLNVDMDLGAFLRINPCGYQGLQMVRTADLSED